MNSRSWNAAQLMAVMQNHQLPDNKLAVIVNLLGPARTTKAVAECRQNMGLRHAKADQWCVANEEILRVHAANSNLSMSQIGRMMGFSKNAIIGKLRRLGIERDYTPNLTRARKARSRRPKAPKIIPIPPPARNTHDFVFGAGHPFGLETAPAIAESVTTDGLRICDPGFRGCRWPLSGEMADRRFCCVETDGQVYCAKHARKAYQVRARAA